MRDQIVGLCSVLCTLCMHSVLRLCIQGYVAYAYSVYSEYACIGIHIVCTHTMYALYAYIVMLHTVVFSLGIQCYLDCR